MSTKEQLSKKDKMAWRNFAMNPAFSIGLDWCRRFGAPKISKGSVQEMLESAIAWNAYISCIESIESLADPDPIPEQSAESPGLVQVTNSNDND
jgi:hypothetical protein